MLSIYDAAPAELCWKSAHAFGMNRTLYTGDTIVATLRFRSAISSLARAESADGCWTFKWIGFRRPRVVIRHCEANEDLAVFTSDIRSGGGTIALSAERTFRATTNIQCTRLKLLGVDDQPLVSYESSGVFRVTHRVQIEPGALDLPDLPWLVLFGEYLMCSYY
jgi:hypothetical protein